MRRRSGFTMVEVGIAAILLGVIFILVFGFLQYGMGHTKTEVDRMSSVRALVLLRASIQLDLGNRGADPVVEVPGPGQLRLAGAVQDVTYSVVAAGPGRGEIYRLQAGKPPRRIGAGFRGVFEAQVDGTKNELVLKIQSWDEARDRATQGAPAMVARFDLGQAAGTTALAGHFVPVLAK